MTQFKEYKVEADRVIDSEGGIVYDDLNPRAADIIAGLLTYNSILEGEKADVGWQPIETAPKDGQWILAYGQGYKELAERGRWVTHDTNDPPVPLTMLVKWIEGWYDKEVDLGDGTYRKERTLSYAYWWPEPHGFTPTHWMPLPAPPIVK